jgi:hypothetical protein
MKKLPIFLQLILIILTIQSKGQGMLVETSAGYCAKPINTASMILKIGYMNLDWEENGSNGAYIKGQYNLSRRADVVQIFGLHYVYNLSGFRLNAGVDYHVGSNDIPNNKQTGFRASYGVTKYFFNTPFIVSADMSGKYFTASVGLFATL